MQVWYPLLEKWKSCKRKRWADAWIRESLSSLQNGSMIPLLTPLTESFLPESSGTQMFPSRTRNGWFLNRKWSFFWRLPENSPKMHDFPSRWFYCSLLKYSCVLQNAPSCLHSKCMHDSHPPMHRSHVMLWCVPELDVAAQWTDHGAFQDHALIMGLSGKRVVISVNSFMHNGCLLMSSLRWCLANGVF